MYNLRPRANTISEEILESEDDENVGGKCSDSEEDQVSVQSETESSSSDDEFSDAENASLSSRLLESGARGRPRSILREVDGFKWKTTKPTRTSGN